MDTTTTLGLTPDGRQVLRLRYGLDDGVERSLSDVGHACGHSYEWVRQRESGAMRRLCILARAYRAGVALSPSQRADLIAFHPAWVAWCKIHPAKAAMLKRPSERQPLKE